LHSECGLTTHHATSIAALRTICDGLPSAHRGEVMQKAILPFMEKHYSQDLIALLAYIVVADGKQKRRHECPLEIDKEKRRIISKVSGVFVSPLPNSSLKPLRDIIWTRSAVDMCDAVITAVASRAIAIFEGSPGRGKAFYYFSLFFIFYLY
jgi:hypothetical protein